MSHMFGSEYDELVARARLGSAYDYQLSDIAEERLPVSGRKRSKCQKPAKLAKQFGADSLEGEKRLPISVDPTTIGKILHLLDQGKSLQQIVEATKISWDQALLGSIFHAVTQYEINGPSGLRTKDDHLNLVKAVVAFTQGWS